MRVTGSAQLHLNAGAAVSLTTVLMEADDSHQELRILQGPGAWLGLAVAPVIIATGGDLQGLTQRANGMLGFHRVNPLIPLVGASERMPKVFFRISRCWRR